MSNVKVVFPPIYSDHSSFLSYPPPFSGALNLVKLQQIGHLFLLRVLLLRPRRSVLRGRRIRLFVEDWTLLNHRGKPHLLGLWDQVSATPNLIPNLLGLWDQVSGLVITPRRYCVPAAYCLLLTACCLFRSPTLATRGPSLRILTPTTSTARIRKMTAGN